MLLRFADLKKMGIVSNWQTLGRWIRDEGFPAGIKLGPNTRAWRKDWVMDWLTTRSAAKDE
jgi:predicted DNA-binding transcriptional regulator AlpA